MLCQTSSSTTTAGYATAPSTVAHQSATDTNPPAMYAYDLGLGDAKRPRRLGGASCVRRSELTNQHSVLIENTEPSPAPTLYSVEAARRKLFGVAVRSAWLLGYEPF